MRIPADAALLAVDLQNGFISEKDELPIAGALEVVPVINLLLPRFGVRIASQDWHPDDHGSFASRHPGTRPFDTGELGGLPQVFWPDHCVQGTRGAELHAALDQRPLQAIFRKGADPRVDSYSVFRDNAGRNPTGLEGYLEGRGVRHLFIAGLALDYCVFFTAKDARRYMPGVSVSVILDGCRPVAARSCDAALEEMRRLGVRLLQSSDLDP